MFFLFAFSSSGGHQAANGNADGSGGAALALPAKGAAGQRAGTASSAGGNGRGDGDSVVPSRGDSQNIDSPLDSQPEGPGKGDAPDSEDVAELARLRVEVERLTSALDALREQSSNAVSQPANDHADEDHDHDALMPHAHDGPPRVLIMVLTVCAGKGPARRQQVRESWMRMMGGSEGATVKGYDSASPALHFDALFYIGECKDAASLATLEKEREAHGDIVYETGFEEKYSNLATKVLHMIRWAARNRVFDMLLKCDDDTFINVPAVVDAVHRNAKDDLTALYMGKLAKGLKPAFEAEKVVWEGHLHHKQFAPFMFGCAYALSRDLAHFLAQKEVQFHAVYGEDTAMGLWLSALTVRRVDLGARINNMGGPDAYGVCKEKFDYFAYHYMDGPKAKERAENFLKHGKPCLSSQLG